MNINELLEKQDVLRKSLTQHKQMIGTLDHLHNQFPDMTYKANVVSTVGTGAVIPLDYVYFREHYLRAQIQHISNELAKVNELIDAVNTLLGQQDAN